MAIAVFVGVGILDPPLVLLPLFFDGQAREPMAGALGGLNFFYWCWERSF